jgi:succinate-semialdehyde dehydrogenase/glutarate-semialdehyde dehydrogenase
LAKKISQELIVGDGMDSKTTIGPLINSSAVEKVKQHISDALEKGANVYSGGKHMSGNFFEPTIVTNVNQNMLFAKEETFGPLAPIYR